MQMLTQISNFFFCYFQEFVEPEHKNPAILMRENVKIMNNNNFQAPSKRN